MVKKIRCWEFHHSNSEILDLENFTLKIPQSSIFIGFSNSWYQNVWTITYSPKTNLKIISRNIIVLCGKRDLALHDRLRSTIILSPGDNYAPCGEFYRPMTKFSIDNYAPCGAFYRPMTKRSIVFMCVFSFLFYCFFFWILCA